ncbi:MAG: Abi family protein [Dermatophilaceae bacterium]
MTADLSRSVLRRPRHRPGVTRPPDADPAAPTQVRPSLDVRAASIGKDLLFRHATTTGGIQLRRSDIGKSRLLDSAILGASGMRCRPSSSFTELIGMTPSEYRGASTALLVHRWYAFSTRPVPPGASWVQGRSSSCVGVAMDNAKQFKTYAEQVELLRARGMDVGEAGAASELLRRVNYYRLSGYWYPFRRLGAKPGRRQDDFYPSTTLADVESLYLFDTRLRAATFTAIAPIELRLRALLGHGLGEVDECAHLRPEFLSPRAQSKDYTTWRESYQRQLGDSREDFVEHHRHAYAGILPVWAAVEILHWGGLVRLFGFAPRSVQDEVADAFGLRAPQLESWMKSLNVVRNVCAHHGRLFNRVYALMPKLPSAGRYPELDSPGVFTRTFGQLTLAQFLLRRSGERTALLPAVLRSYPSIPAVPVTHLGAPTDWADHDLWSSGARESRN